MSTFADRLIDWQRLSGRHDLPWQTDDAYLVWLSEIMLQQTQVATVIPYYLRFVAAFPTVSQLAAAPLDQVLALWSGLGYYQRARNLHCAAQQVVERHAGIFPNAFTQLQELPGVGRSTAAAIAVFAGGERQAILDGNVRRVLARHRGIEGDLSRASELAKLWRWAEELLPISNDIAGYTQGLMDLGSLVCTRSRPRCQHCPVAADCVAQLSQRQAQLPSPRKRRAVAQRQVIWLLLRQGDRVYLEQRPPSGIWGRLWTLPEFADDSAASRWLVRWGNPQLRTLTTISHLFTHLTLSAEVLTAEVTPQPVVEDCGGGWFGPADLANVGLPQPVSQLLGSAKSAGDKEIPEGR